MIYEICHRLEYRYDAPVYLEPHSLHLVPRTDASQRLKQFSLRIHPEPNLTSEMSDELGNPAHEIWFGGLTDFLIIETTSRVEVTRENPFHYLLHENSLRIPIKYSRSLDSFLAPYQSFTEKDSHVEEFSNRVAHLAGYETLGFLSELGLAICKRIQQTRREEGFPLPPGQTLRQGYGACRDLAMLFMACCSSLGFAVRFTSGYREGASGDLHAWAEVYLEGAGWRGYDPSTGLAVGEQYVALASSPDPRRVSPVIGTYRSNSVSSVLKTSVEVCSLYPGAESSFLLSR